MWPLTTVIGELIRQLNSKGDVKQSYKTLGNFPPSTGASGNNEKYNPPKPGEPLKKMLGKQMKYYCSKCNRRKGFWGWYEERIHDKNHVPKPRDNSRKRENSGTPQLQLDNDTKKSLETHTGGMVDVTDEYELDF